MFKPSSNVCNNRPDLEHAIQDWRRCATKTCFGSSSKADGQQSKLLFEFKKNFPYDGYPEITYEELQTLESRDFDVPTDDSQKDTEGFSFESTYPFDLRFVYHTLNQRHNDDNHMIQLFGESENHKRLANYESSLKSYISGTYGVMQHFTHQYALNSVSYTYTSKMNTESTTDNGSYAEINTNDMKYDYYSYIVSYITNAIGYAHCISDEGMFNHVGTWLPNNTGCHYTGVMHYSITAGNKSEQSDRLHIGNDEGTERYAQGNTGENNPLPVIKQKQYDWWYYVMFTNMLSGVDPSHFRLYYSSTKTMFMGFTGEGFDLAINLKPIWLVGHFKNGEQIIGYWFQNGAAHGTFIIRREMTQPTGTISLVKKERGITNYHRILLMDGFAMKRKRIEISEIENLLNRDSVQMRYDQAIGYAKGYKYYNTWISIKECSFTYRGIKIDFQNQKATFLGGYLWHTTNGRILVDDLELGYGEKFSARYVNKGGSLTYPYYYYVNNAGNIFILKIQIMKKEKLNQKLYQEIMILRMQAQEV